MRHRHGTVVAYLALFLVLGGTGWAATHGGGLKVRCTATRNGRQIACRVVSGSGVGPRGPRGFRGPRGAAGAAGAAGASTFTSPPAYVLQPGAMSGVNSVYSDPSQEWQRANLYVFNRATSPLTSVWRTNLLSPSQLDGSPAHLRSVEFCFGLQDSTSGGRPATLSISHLTVHELSQSAAIVPSQPTPVYATTALIDQPLSITGTDAGFSGCQTVTPNPAPAIAPGGFLVMDLQAAIVAPNAPPSGNAGPYQGWLYLGRLSVTYGP